MKLMAPHLYFESLCHYIQITSPSLASCLGSAAELYMLDVGRDSVQIKECFEIFVF